MLKQRSKLLLAVALFVSIAFVSCNNDADKATETTTTDSVTTMQTTEQKMDTTPAPAPVDTSKKMDTSAVTKPLKTVP